MQSSSPNSPVLLLLSALAASVDLEEAGNVSGALDTLRSACDQVEQQTPQPMTMEQ